MENDKGETKIRKKQLFFKVEDDKQKKNLKKGEKQGGRRQRGKSHR